jgi:hypothetical protein
MTSKPSWEQPKLVVLGRGAPEENVLHVCKNLDAGGPNSTGNCHIIKTPPPQTVSCITGVTGS